MARIKILPQHLANQIAAGEVVERPASVIKELVENSIDAGAKKISIEIELGGRRLMKITDDGIGISKEDAELAFTRHATSKLSELNDLESIRTLGFRGEALASIAAVSKIELLSKTDEEEIATSVNNRDGGFVVSETARTTGTTITVRDLFFNTPARRKFLRSQPTENFHIASIVTHYALANPSLSFLLTNNGRETLRVSKARDLRERAYQIFGNDLIESLIPVNSGDGGFMKVTGFVSAPRERRTSRDSQYFFINGRFVKDKVVSKGLSEGYRAVLPHGVFPVAFLFLELPPEEVDVNVHPSKTEVRFRRAEAIKEVIATAVRNALSKSGIRVSSGEANLDGRQVGYEGQSAESEAPAQSEPIARSATAYASPADPVFDLIPDEAHKPEIEQSKGIAESEQHANFSAPADSNSSPAGYAVLPPVDSAYSLPNEFDPSELDAAKIRPIGQLHDSFIIASDDQGLLLVDQHVAHERILFDYFREREANRGIESQNLLIPETIDLTPAQSVAFGELREQLELYGFEVNEMSGRTVAIKSVPADLPAGEASNLFSEILDTIEIPVQGDASKSIKDDIAASLACKAAVKINMKLTEEKMRWMIENLLLTSSPSTCPHGRPVVLRLTLKDIERRFHRT